MNNTILRLAFDEEFEEYLKSKYNNNNQFSSDVGFDLYLPEDCIINEGQTTVINMRIKCEFQSLDNNTYYGYQLVPRSSLSKTKIRLANSIGIIDPNYRGNLKVAVDNIGTSPVKLNMGERYFQLVFMPIYKPTVVEYVSELSDTDRGTGCFGSTGK